MLLRLRLRGGSALSFEGLRGANETASVQEEMDMLTGSQVLPAETNADRVLLGWCETRALATTRRCDPGPFRKSFLRHACSSSRGCVSDSCRKLGRAMTPSGCQVSVLLESGGEMRGVLLGCDAIMNVVLKGPVEYWGAHGLPLVGQSETESSSAPGGPDPWI